MQLDCRHPCELEKFVHSASLQPQRNCMFEASLRCLYIRRLICACSGPCIRNFECSLPSRSSTDLKQVGYAFHYGETEPQPCAQLTHEAQGPANPTQHCFAEQIYVDAASAWHKQARGNSTMNRARPPLHRRSQASGDHAETLPANQLSDTGSLHSTQKGFVDKEEEDQC